MCVTSVTFWVVVIADILAYLDECTGFIYFPEKEYKRRGTEEFRKPEV